MSANILVVDDEKDILEALQELLQMEDYTVICANNGREGIRLFQEHEFALVITDLMMPVMNGMDMIRFMREELKSGVPIIMMSAAVAVANLESQGWDKFIRKPGDIDLIVGIIEDLLKKGR